MRPKFSEAPTRDRLHDGLDWVKPPHYRSPWYTHHSLHLLKYYLDYSDRINGYVAQTINISIVSPFDEFDNPNLTNLQLNISPMYSLVDERGIYLTKVHINQLNLTYLGTKKVKFYGTVKIYSGIKLRITSPKCYSVTYQIPDAYVYELPEIFSSAQLTTPSTSDFFQNSGIPQRHGIIHGSIFYQHAIISYQNILYGLTDELFHISGIPEIISKYPRCELSTSYSTFHVHKLQRYNANINFRPFIYLDSTELDEDDPHRYIHPSFFDDHIDRSVELPTIYLNIKQYLQCYYCKKLNISKNKTKGLAMIYCPLCRKNCVQSPHIYCSRYCLLSHRHDHYHYHETSQNEHQILEPNDLVDSSKPVHYSNTQPSANTPTILNTIKRVEFTEYLLIENEGDEQHHEEKIDYNETEGSNPTNEKKFQREKYENFLRKVEIELQHEEFFGIKFDRVEVWIGVLICFYLCCYLILRYGEVDQELREHDEM